MPVFVECSSAISSVVQANFLDLGGERKGEEADGGGFYSWELPLQKFLR